MAKHKIFNWVHLFLHVPVSLQFQDYLSEFTYFTGKNAEKVQFNFPKGIEIVCFEPVFLFQLMKAFLFCLKKA